MATQKFLTQSGGVLQENLPTTTSAGAADAGKLPGLDSTGRLDMSMMPVGLGAHTQVITASEAISAGAFVNIYNNAGAFAVRNADAATGKRAHGFVLAAVANGAQATVYPDGLNTALSGLTAGEYYLSDSAVGAIVSTPPTTAGHIVQRVGVAMNATTLNCALGQAITLA